MILSKIDRLRDPAILVENGVYYAYGTGWVCYKNTSGSLDGEWESLGMVATVPKNAQTNYWAPEVHKYNGEFYMFTTYKSSENGHRGCTIMKSSSPEGPFIEISNGHLTPCDWDAIDATFYVDEEGQPWMVFVHEWTSTDDGIGRMAAAKLSSDLTCFISEPIELFRADDAPWANYCVTDGCWMYKCQTGELIMIWSNFAPDGYSIGIARSDNGRLDGKWTQDANRLFSKEITGNYDGGHGMIFKTLEDRLCLSLHSPNAPEGERQEKPIFVFIKEQNGTLVWDE
ncbi:MAG: glycoside hydrolase [Ruminococcaceae bacterium]|nr:glycoside hydrolase [Oscillospiraceae bacterium]